MSGTRRKKRPSTETKGQCFLFFQETFGTISEELNELKNGHVIWLYLDLNKSTTAVSKILKSKFNIIVSVNHVRSLINGTINKYWKHFHDREQDAKKLTDISQERFHQFKQCETDAGGSTSSASLQQEQQPQAEDPRPSTPPLPPQPAIDISTPVRGPIPESPLSAGMRSLKRRNVNLTPRKIELQRRNEKLRQRNKDLIVRLKEVKPRKLFASAKKVKNKYLRQEIRRLKSRLEKEKQKAKGKGVRESKTNLRRQLSYYKTKAENIISKDMYEKVLKENEELKKELREKDEMLAAHENNIQLLEEKLAEAMQGQESVWDCKHGSAFNSETRELIFNMIDLGVPTKNVEDLMVKSGGTFGYSVTNPPKRSSVENMARELGAISDYQSAKFMLESEQLSLGFDATTQEGVHVNGVYVSSKDESKVIAFDELAGGTHIDYQEQIDDSITNMAKVYCQVHEESQIEIRSQLISKITSTMSDRAAVNHATIQLLEKKWNTKLTELNCHLHPLESIARDCSTALTNIEKQTGNQQKDLYSHGCIGQRLVYNISKIRYSDGKGDPRGFKNALQEGGYQKGFIPRYRGNRLHIQFHIAQKLFAEEKFFTKLFKGTLSCQTTCRAMERSYLSEYGRSELQVLGLIGKLVSSPWMTRFYVEKGSDLSHFQAYTIIKSVQEEVKKYADNPALTLTTTVNCFGDSLLDDVKPLQVPPINENTFLAMMGKCMTATDQVISRQYAKYATMEMSEELEQKTSSARLHNIEAEQMMGMFSARQLMKPNASLDFLACGIKARKNKTTAFLATLHAPFKAKLIKLAIKIGREQREERKKTTVEVEKEINRRMAKKQKKSEAERRKLEKDLKSKGLSEMIKDNEDWNVLRSELDTILAGDLQGFINHVWYDEDTKDNVVYSGRVKKFLKGKSQYRIQYWGEGETYDDDAESWSISMYSLAIDLTQGDLVIQ